ncbi:hypothetical protein AV530_013329 [Patagioenas fasciata monilis]|uniref:Uncharacterized protein n=1 Tax=Patagioenas fasciata monilis TaxID=372326 RepID=A0A1V4JP25_PATFA|nr:hypothetical protein AV530_013329 [Patagioenas fasciata monilis]
MQTGSELFCYRYPAELGKNTNSRTLQQVRYILTVQNRKPQRPVLILHACEEDKTMLRAPVRALMEWHSLSLSSDAAV